MNQNEIVLFESADHEVRLPVETDRKTVWLTRQQMADLFGRDVKTIGKHIANALKEELDASAVAKYATTAADGKTYQTEHYSLDMIISVGYRVKSSRGVEFRRWANNVLKQYVLQGYAVNEKLLAAQGKTIQLQARMIAGLIEGDEKEVFKAVNAYTDALTLLDCYDHQSLSRPQGNEPIYRLTYAECRKIIDQMEYAGKSEVFGVEKEAGKVEGILAAVYQNVFGQEVYPSLEEKAASLLYFMIKDHPFADGCKRIAASLFLEFLNRNSILFRDGQPLISNAALVAMTLMIAESRPEEKDAMITLVMNFLA
ncbi:MAG: virulence RhuM family protein [Solobacterium sp.]|nr:virulence RhuM family protein [Solobacterium sp.]